MLAFLVMTPPFEKSATMSSPAATGVEPNSPEALARATAELRALGVDDEVVFIARTPAELRAFLRSREPACAPST